MKVIQKTCRVTGQPFVITVEDQAFYTKMGVSLPTLSPAARSQRRLAFRNERKLFHRKCDLCQKEMIASYSPDSSYIVYCQNCFWSDKWNPMDFGLEPDFSRPFFEQFNELMNKVPRISLMNKEHENSEYGNFTLRNKNSYLLTTCANCEDSFYSKRSWYSKNICDCSNLTRCELCYETLDSANCYNCSWLQNSSQCTDCVLGYNLKNCQNCFGCFNLVNQQYCINNQALSPEDYAIKLNELKAHLPEEINKFYSRTDISRKYMDGINNENCSGDAVYNSKNSHYCFDATRLEDCKYVCDATLVKDSYDMNNGDNSELLYECSGNEENYFCRFIDICWFNKFSDYCSLCFHSESLFGCVSVVKGKYCILNKVYSKEEFGVMKEKLIRHMQETGEWGEFFPMELSPFAYNETVAHDYFPLTAEQAQSIGLKWSRETEALAYQGPKLTPPEWARDADLNITKSIFTCVASGKLFKITPQELELYKKMDVPLPKKAPEQRFADRMQRKNPRKLWTRNCSDCGQEIETVYPPDRPEKVLCEACYLKEVY